MLLAEYIIYLSKHRLIKRHIIYISPVYSPITMKLTALFVLAVLILYIT